MSNRTRTARSGFTIIELMVVLVIIALLSGVAAVASVPVLRDAKMRSACRTVASVINYARSHAASSGNPTRVVFDGTSVYLAVSVDDGTGTPVISTLTTTAGRRHNLPDGVTVTQIVKADTSDQENWIEFSSTGQAEQAIVQITDNSHQNRYVIVDPITGRCKVDTQADLEHEQGTGVEQLSK